MLTANYEAKINSVLHKSASQSYRNQTALQLIESYRHRFYSAREGNRMLFDVARLLGMTDHEEWKESHIKSIGTDCSPSDGADAKMAKLIEKAQEAIAQFRERDYFEDFTRFEEVWKGREFDSIDQFMEDFYRYIPYVKLGIDQEKEISQLPDSATPFERSLARKKAVIRRVEETFLDNPPEELPEMVRESMIDYAARVGEESVPRTVG